MITFFTVASVTVWVGRLPRNFNGESLFNHFNEYADVKNIDVCNIYFDMCIISVLETFHKLFERTFT